MGLTASGSKDLGLEVRGYVRFKLEFQGFCFRALHLRLRDQVFKAQGSGLSVQSLGFRYVEVDGSWFRGAHSGLQPPEGAPAAGTIGGK